MQILRKLAVSRRKDAIFLREYLKNILTSVPGRRAGHLSERQEVLRSNLHLGHQVTRLRELRFSVGTETTDSSIHMQTFEILSFEIGSFKILSFDILSFDILSFDILSFDILSFDILSFDIFSFDILPFDILDFDKKCRFIFDSIAELSVFLYHVIDLRVNHCLTVDHNGPGTNFTKLFSGRKFFWTNFCY
jgi:hypothetical protein